MILQLSRLEATVKWLAGWSGQSVFMWDSVVRSVPFKKLNAGLSFIAVCDPVPVPTGACSNRAMRNETILIEIRKFTFKKRQTYHTVVGR